MAKIDLTNKDKINGVLSFIFLKKLIAPVNKTDAFKLGLVDSQGKTIKIPETDEEKSALSLFDKFMFKIKRLLGSKTAQLNNFIYLQTATDDFYDKLIITGGLDKKAQVKRIQRDLENLIEKYDIEFDELLRFMIAEEIKKNDKELL